MQKPKISSSFYPNSSFGLFRKFGVVNEIAKS